MTFVLAMLIGLTAYLFGTVHWVIALVRRGWRQPAGWFAGTGVLLLPPTALTYFAGAFAGGLDVPEECGLSGHIYDGDYALAHRSDMFPLSHPCNAEHDLVSGWVNPTLAVLTLLMVGCAATAVVLALRRRRRPPAGTATRKEH
ncbi:hypothetical protein SAMN05421678_1122 [Actinopolymorpha cephalotaxi]|uniref:Uncharacterized protein n=1 Tax=Actinopolymorpha cephalotaxi TaxID=504797 RepID=A0A1I2X790_9ACTN|nr:hypothetical protein [Actinopolymorpha cephalotaxi]NYH86065.1 hypothetical protein [Actinopolymorpha cephalotaxi]SFH08556.1 hypothetical protein SAMN05421678_1122 [Actinopolymorpha cephalotaxi]